MVNISIISGIIKIQPMVNISPTIVIRLTIKPMSNNINNNVIIVLPPS